MLINCSFTSLQFTSAMCVKIVKFSHAILVLKIHRNYCCVYYYEQLLSSVVGDDEEEMQSDMSSYGRFEGSGARRYSSNDDDEGDDDLSDDEDINADESGSGSDGKLTKF